MAIQDQLGEYTFTYLINECLANVDDKFDKREGSIIYDALAPACYVLAGYYDNLNNAIKQCYGTMATGDNLDEITNSLGVNRIEGTNAYLWLYIDYSAVGVTDSALVGEKFHFAMADGSEWEFVIKMYDPNNAKTFKCLSSIVGNWDTLLNSRLNNYAISDNSILNEAEVDKSDGSYTDNNYGKDDETDEELRTRYLEYLAYNRFGGNFTDYLALTEIAPSLLSGVDDTGNYAYNMGVIRGSQLNVYMWLCKHYTDTGEYVAVDSDTISNIKEELDPTTVTGKGLGYVPIGHLLNVGSMTVVTPTIAVGIDGNTISADLIHDAFKQAALDFYHEKNETDIQHRNYDGSYNPFLFSWADLITIWGNCWRPGFGEIVSMTGTMTGYTPIAQFGQKVEINRDTTNFSIFGDNIIVQIIEIS